MLKKLFNTQFLLWLALLLALIGSLTHVAWGFGTLEQGNLVMGYIQAVAVDVGLFALAIGIQKNREQQRPTRWLWGGVIFFALISTYANLLHGLAFASPLALPGWEWLVALRPFVLSGVLPILVVYLSEVAAAHYRHGNAPEAEAERGGLVIPLGVQANVFLDRWLETHGKDPTIFEFKHHFHEQTGADVSEAEADELIIGWRGLRGRAGRRVTVPSTTLPLAVNGSGVAEGPAD